MCELWLSWLRTGDKPKSTAEEGMSSHADAFNASSSWWKVWPCHSLLGSCMKVLYSEAGLDDHGPSGNEAWLHGWPLISW